MTADTPDRPAKMTARDWRLKAEKLQAELDEMHMLRKAVEALAGKEHQSYVATMEDILDGASRVTEAIDALDKEREEIGERAEAEKEKFLAALGMDAWEWDRVSWKY